MASSTERRRSDSSREVAPPALRVSHLHGSGQDVTAVVLCAGINGFGAVRSLAVSGIRPAVIYHEKDNPVHFSCYPAAKHYFPRPLDEESLLLQLQHYGANSAVVIPCSDFSAEFLSAHRNRLLAAGLKLVIPPGDVTAILNDKASEIDLIGRHNIVLPNSLTSIPSSASDLLGKLKLPIIIKPRSFREMRLIRGKNVILKNELQAKEFIDAHQAHLDGFVAQEVVEGPDEDLWVCNCCFNYESELVSAFTFQRIRMSPPHFGVTTFAVGINNPQIKQICANIGAALKYRGPAMIEFKHCRQRNEYCYIETNPRLGMCNVFDTYSGVNNVSTAYKIARGELVGRDPDYQVDGVYFLNGYGDFYSRVSDNEPIADILRSYWRCRKSRIAWAVYEPNDLRPFLHSMQNLSKSLARSVARKLTGRKQGAALSADPT